MKYIPIEDRRIVRESFGDETTRTFVLFDDTKVSEGGWYYGRAWMTAAFLAAAEKRWVANCYKTGQDQPEEDGSKAYPDWIPHQCGGCRWFAALDLDYGVCCQESSPNDGRITFEHGGCHQHSILLDRITTK
ncbi:hypothetical protein LCGC14_1499800 [marine sediment metagenome]|uniref:Uncharacterized protein n=1 Tax=marine sediment metagenome TaxID=412755 RepID=A0A0F9LK33_9ZZZZ